MGPCVLWGSATRHQISVGRTRWMVLVLVRRIFVRPSKTLACIRLVVRPYVRDDWDALCPSPVTEAVVCASEPSSCVPSQRVLKPFWPPQATLSPWALSLCGAFSLVPQSWFLNPCSSIWFDQVSPDNSCSPCNFSILNPHTYP
jgi:hypothetical protein